MFKIFLRGTKLQLVIEFFFDFQVGFSYGATLLSIYLKDREPNCISLHNGRTKELAEQNMLKNVEYRIVVATRLQLATSRL